MSKTTHCAVAVAALLCLAQPAPAAVVFDNLGASPGGADGITDFGPLAVSFSTGSGGFLLADVEVLLSILSTSNGSIQASLLNDSGTSPGTLVASLGTISDSILSFSPAVIDLPQGTPIGLAPNTRYWVELSSGDSGGGWSWSQDLSGPGVAGEFFANHNGVFPNEGGPYQMCAADADGGCSAALTPEPASLVLLGGALLGLGVARGRKQRG